VGIIVAEGRGARKAHCPEVDANIAVGIHRDRRDEPRR